MAPERREDYLKIHTTLAEFKVMLEESRSDTREIKELLLGNGQPGFIDKISGRVGHLEEAWSTTKGWLKGIAAVFSVLFSFLLAWIAKER